MSDSVIVFNQIPADVQVPGAYVEIQESQLNPGLFAYPARVLLMGQKMASGTGVQNQIYKNIVQVSDATSLGGAGSMIETMVLFALQAGTGVPIDIVMLNDAVSATAATFTFTFTGAIAAGEVNFYIGGIWVPVAISATDTYTSFFANAVAAINGTQYMQGVATSSTSSGNVITITANQKGPSGNDLACEMNPLPGQQMPGAMLCVVAPGVAGVGSVNITPLLAATAGNWYTDWGMPWQDAPNLELLEALLVENANAMVAQGGKAYAVLTGTYAAILAAADGGAPEYMATLGVTAPVSPPWAIVASLTVAAAQALLTDPSRQLRGLTLAGITPPRPQNQYGAFPARQNLLTAGVATYMANADGTMAIERLVTANTENQAGVPDQTWHDIMTVAVAQRIAFDWASYTASLYPRPKLAPDGSVAALNDPTVVTPSRRLGSWAARCTYYATLGWIDNLSETLPQAQFVINTTDPGGNRMDGVMPISVIGNLMVTADVLQVSN